MPEDKKICEECGAELEVCIDCGQHWCQQCEGFHFCSALESWERP
jgi:hypothetical protein